MAALYVSHPEVIIDPELEVARWRLSETGVARMRAFVASPVVSAVGEVWASGETKAIEAAGLLAARFGLPVNVHPGLGENDRRATGYLPQAEFNAVADAFFSRPTESIRGWEPALAAQTRVRAAVTSILAARRGAGDIAFIGHGGVGTLLFCAFDGAPITRDRDQPFAGHYWSFDPQTLRALHGWRPIAPATPNAG